MSLRGCILMVFGIIAFGYEMDESWVVRMGDEVGCSLCYAEEAQQLRSR